MSFAKIGEIEGEVGWERFLMKGLVQGILNLGCLLDIQVEIKWAVGYATLELKLRSGFRRCQPRGST